MTENQLKRAQLVKLLLTQENSEVENDEEFLHLLLDEKVSKNVNQLHEKKLTRGEIMADHLAQFAGSWFFITSFSLILFVWITTNLLFLKTPFDPFPFILLNLVLSSVAAIQAPVIMMSQNRQETKDRLRSESDYKVNLKAELIVEDMHQKLDELIERQVNIETELMKLSDSLKLNSK